MCKKLILFSLSILAITLCILAICIPSNAATIYGDLNSDGSINSKDYSLMKRAILGNYTLTDTTAADLNGDKAVNSTDYSLLKRYILGTITKFPVESSVTPTPTPVPATPTPSLNPEDAWKSNTGTINLGSTITCSGAGISVNGSIVNITAGGDHTVTGTLTSGMIIIDTQEKVKLRLNGVSITNPTGPAVYVKSADKAYITLNDGTTNTLTDGSSYSDTTLKGALFSNDSLEIKGSGTLIVTGNYKHGIVCDDDIEIGNGNITVKSAAKNAIHANDNITIDGGTINVTATKDGIKCDKGDIIINKGTINVASAGEYGLCAETDLYVAGGTIDVTAATSGLYSNGTIEVIGGNAVAYGGINCGTNTFTITGGTCMGLGATTSTPSANASTQCSVVLGGASAGDVVSIKNSSGTEIVNFTARKTYKTLMFTSPSLLLNTTYTMYINGTASKTFTTSSLVTN